jgi:dolichyl-phosphate-mannose--protein O-mannosyl transferase
MTLTPGPEALVAPAAAPAEEFGAAPGSRPSHAKIAVTAGVIAVLTLLLLLARINHPAGLVLDENSYVGIARSLLDGTLGPLPQTFSKATFGRQHPPLAPYLIAAGMKVAGDNPVGWRLAGAVAGALTMVAVFFWTYLLLRDYGLAVMAAALTLFNSFLYVLARAAILDAFLFLFLIWGILAFTMALELDVRKGTRRALMLACGLLFGLGAACKWNAVDTWASVLVIAFALRGCGKYIARDNLRLRRSGENLRAIGLPMLVVSLIVAPPVAYALTFVPLFRAEHIPFSVPVLVRLHALMFHLTTIAPGSRTLYAAWYSWPFRWSPMRGLSYLLGNPVVMWVGMLALVACARRLWKRLALPEAMVLCLYLANLLQWAVTPIKTPTYYYYFPAAMFLGPAIAVALSYPARRQVFGVRLNVLLVVAAAVVFLYCYPRMAYLQSPWDCMFGCWN